MRTLALIGVAACLAAMTAAAPSEKGIIINLDNGNLCVLSAQCKSSCCHRRSATSLARCAPKSAETHKCSAKVRSLYGSYYFCPCEDGLKCDTDWSIGGSITNTNFGVCVDPNAPKSSAA
uniref:Colipase n=1 Tax=Denticeps clupeoides TaxID=299321 RepID=A0AAY4BFN1_9TELE